MQKPLKLFVIVLLFLLAVMACSCTPRRSELAGSYVLRDLSRTGRLQLRTDGTFTEDVVNKLGGKIHVDGRWELGPDGLTRKPCVHFALEGGELRYDLCVQAVQRSVSGPQIYIEPDFGLLYER